jgi:hypothetical protein
VLTVLVVVTILKVVIGTQALMHGLPGSYFDNTRYQGAAEQSTEFRGEPWTRRERRLSFGGDEFPVYFLNDVQRFNFFGPEAEKRRTLPFSVRWDGAVFVPASGSYQVWLTASGPATLSVDGKQVASVDADGRETAVVRLTLDKGSHPIRVSYIRRPQRSPDLKVEWDALGGRQALASPYVFPSAVTEQQWDRDGLFEIVAKVLDGVYLSMVGLAGLGLVAGAALRATYARPRSWESVERPLLGAFLVATYVMAALPGLDRVDKLTLLGGGQDWLTHESFARDILLNGPLMTLGKPLGEGRTFYAQPFYPYALAAMHWLTGEDQFGAMTLQVFGVGVAGVLLYFLAKRLFGLPAALGTFAVFLVLDQRHLDWVARRLLSEPVYFVVLPALLLLLVRCLDEWRRSDMVLAGLLLGLAVVTRGPTLLMVPFVAAILWVGLRRAGLSRAIVTNRLAVLFAIAALIVVLVPIRNQIVAGQPSLVASSGGVNLQKLHRPTPRVRLSLAQDRWFAPYIQDAPTRETVEFILQDPAGYIESCILLAAYTLGYGAAIDESQITVWPDLVFLNLLYLGSILFLRSARSLRAALLHAFVATHFVTMVLFVPYDYDNRLVLPMYLPMAVFGGYALARAVQGVAGRLARPVVEASTPQPTPLREGEGAGARG